MSPISLSSAALSQNYQINKIDVDNDTKNKLSNIGIVKFARVLLLSRDKNNAILSLPSGKFAINSDILEKIFVTDLIDNKDNYLSLDLIEVGESCKVINVYGKPEIKRKLMDMGITKNTVISVKKISPLGDPIEVFLRNYSLTLLKVEASFILVERI